MQSNKEEKTIDYAKLDVDELKKLASGGIFSKGDPKAQYALGKLLEGIPEKRKECFKWYKEAADQGNPQAQERVGTAYVSTFGERCGVKRDEEKAFYWIKLSAAQNYAPAQVTMAEILKGIVFTITKNIKPSPEQSIALCNKVINENNKDPDSVGKAYQILGWHYLNGRGVKADVIRALDLYLKARSLGQIKDELFGFLWHYVEKPSFHKKSFPEYLTANESGEYYRSLIGYERIELSATEKNLLDKLTGYVKQDNLDSLGCYYLSLIENQYRNNPGELVIEYLTKAAKHSSEANYQLYRCYDLGLASVQKDKDIASKYLVSAAKAHHMSATYQLGKCYETGYGTISADPKQAAEYYNIILESKAENSSLAESALEKLFLSKPITKEHILNQRAKYKNDPEAQTGMGLIALKEKNDKEAFEWFQKAANKNYTEAEYELGKCYANGCGVSQNPLTAREFLRKAAVKKHSDAKIELTNLYKTKIFPALQNDQKSLELNLQHTSFEDKDILTLSELLQVNTTLVKLDLRNTSITALNVEKLTEALKFRQTKLEVLHNGGTSLVIPQPLSQSLVSPTRSPTKSDNEDKISFSIGYTIQFEEIVYGDEIGEGAFGKVYKGSWRKTTVAIKELKGDIKGDTLEEFKNEAKIMTQLQSEYLVRLYGVCINTKFCMVMQYMPNGTLFQLLKSNQPLAWSQRYRIATDIACGILFLHEEGILHRDIKSLNVLLDKDYRAKLTDFGLSKVKKVAQSTATKGDTVGTIRWMAPELFSRKAIYTQKSDIYSLGITFWEIAARKIPFADAENPNLIPTWVSQDDREDIPSDCPPGMVGLIKSCWNTKPEDRPTIKEVVSRLEAEAEKATTEVDSLRSGYQSNLATLKR